MGSWKVFYDGVIRVIYYPTTSESWEIGFWDMRGGETCAAAAARFHGIRDGLVAQFAAQQQAAILANQANVIAGQKAAADTVAALAASAALMERVQANVDNLNAALLGLEP